MINAITTTTATTAIDWRTRTERSLVEVYRRQIVLLSATACTPEEQQSRKQGMGLNEKSIQRLEALLKS